MYQQTNKQTAVQLYFAHDIACSTSFILFFSFHSPPSSLCCVKLTTQILFAICTKTTAMIPFALFRPANLQQYAGFISNMVNARG
ncbi:MAG: hypothetical protein JOS17DRAFT_755102 [Linnemannia elongata]|nr:MAG: hypothetical protein JOS17DRAFT_755102 [Linnemannia elongata]